MVDTLDDAMRQGKGRDSLDKALKELIRYTQTHFATEERLMKAHGFSEYEEHKIKHDKMAQKVLELQKQYQEGRKTITIDVMHFLQDLAAEAHHGDRHEVWALSEQQGDQLSHLP